MLENRLKLRSGWRTPFCACTKDFASRFFLSTTLVWCWCVQIYGGDFFMSLLSSERVLVSWPRPICVFDFYTPRAESKRIRILGDAIHLRPECLPPERPTTTETVRPPGRGSAPGGPPGRRLRPASRLGTFIHSCSVFVHTFLSRICLIICFWSVLFRKIYFEQKLWSLRFSLWACK